MGSKTDPIRVLHVDDEADFVELVADFLGREDDRFEIVAETSANDGLGQLEAAEFDCVISDYQMPGMDGLEFLAAVRDDRPDLPFILFTGQGSEEIASEAISTGATDYLQKRAGSEQYELLANRVRNAVEQYKSRRRATNLNRIRTLAADINQVLVRASTRAELESRVCERFSRAEPYRFAWIGEGGGDSDGIRLRTVAGAHDDYLATVGAAELAEGPSGTALRDRRLAVVQDLHDDAVSGLWSAEAVERGFRAVAALPLDFNEQVFGTLTVYATRPEVFDADERALLEELGADIGHAIAALETQSELRNQKDRFQQLVESAHAAIVMIDTDSEIQFANSATEDVFGYPPTELEGEPLPLLMPERYRDRHLSGVAQYLETGERQVDWSWVEFTGLRKDGQEIELGISFGEFEADGKKYFEGIIRELSDSRSQSGKSG